MKKRVVSRVLLTKAWSSLDCVQGVAGYAVRPGWHLDLTSFISRGLPEK